MAHRGSVLVVEDNEDHREALAALVTLAGLDVVGASTALEALSHLRRQPGRWCLVVLDWWLPDMTGEDFCATLRADPRLARLAVAAMTGDVRARETAERLGLAHFLVKPVEPDIITALLSSHCRGVKAKVGTECGCGGRATSQREQVFARVPYGAIWKTILLAEKQREESRQVRERACQVRELARSARGLHFTAPRASHPQRSISEDSGVMPWLLPDHHDGRAA